MEMGIEICHMQRASVRGRKFFHRRCMSWSYRNRGYDARIHRNRTVKASVFNTNFIVKAAGNVVVGMVLKKIMVVRAFIMIIFVYSAMKNKAKGPAAYSTL